MPTRECQSAGGKATAVISRKNAIDGYYANPNTCLQCGSVIKVPDGGKVSETKQKKFCDHACAAAYNNLNRVRIRKIAIRSCVSCGCDLDTAFNRKRRYCNSCLTRLRVSATSKRSGRSATEHMSNRTKGDMFSGRIGWQSARSSIRNNAKEVFLLSGKNLKCNECGYETYAEVCHIKPVSEFPDTALISEINDINNLVALCPNHHWEFDHGIITLRDRLESGTSGGS